MAKRKKAAPKVPAKIYAQVSPKSIGGVSMFESSSMITTTDVENYFSEKEVTLNAVEDLKKAGFTILQITNSTINICGSPSVYKKAFGQEIHAIERESMKSGPDEEMVTFLDTVNDDMEGLIVPKSGGMSNYIEGVALETPIYFFAPNILPPKKEYWHLQVPGDVSVACNADKVHRTGVTGKGVNIAMVDSGFYRHPFFTSRGYRVRPTVLGPGASNPLRDDNGHGTAECANIFATAPDAIVHPVKINFANSTGAFNSAVALNPQIITCSWGSSRRNSLTAANQVLAAAVASAVNREIVVVFSAGNGHWGFPGQHPDVISAGGVFMDDDMSLQASNYSSGFDSFIYSGRRVPDVCGLVGQRPRASYIMLPLQERSQIDVGLAGGNHPNGDETTQSDGWAAISGTSAAAPQLAGVAALIKQTCRRATPEQVRAHLTSTAIDIINGRSNISTGGNPSVAGPDNSTGHGLVNAFRAVIRAKFSCRVRPPLVVPPVRPPLVVPPVVSPVRPPIVPPLPPVLPPIPPVVNLEYEQSTTQELIQSEEQFFTDNELDEAMEMLDEGTFDIDDFNL